MKKHLSIESIPLTLPRRGLACYGFSYALSLCFAGMAWALPQGADVKGGSASFSQTANELIVNQHSDKLSVNYQSFDIGASERVQFNQPSASSVALNRVIGNDASEIFGELKANGQVFLINPNGILFGESAHVDVAGLLASTLDLSDEDFFAGHHFLNGESSASIINQGLIEAANQGYIMLASPFIENQGELNAPKGQVILEAADEVLLSFSDQAVAILADAETLEALIENEGLIEAEGGQVILNASAHNSLHQTVVNNSGIVRATRMTEVDGEIIISAGGGDLSNTGLLEASAATDDMSGGVIELTGNRISQAGDIAAKGEGLGDGGEVLVRAEEALLITQGESDVSGGNEGNGGELIYFADGATLFTETASLAARSGDDSGDGGFIEVSGLDFVAVEGQVDASSQQGAAGTFLIDPTNIEITNVQNEGIFSAIVGGFEWLPSALGTPSQVDSATLTGLLAGGNNIVVDTARVDTGVDVGTLSVLVDIDLDGGNGQTLSLIADDSITLAANVKIQDSDTLTPDAVTVNLTSSNNITFNNDADIFTTGGNSTVIASNNLVMSGNSSIQTDTGTISVIANNVSLVGKLDSNSALDNAISINSATQISDSGAATIDIEAPNGGIVLQADTGIDVDINTAKVDIENSTSGTVTIQGNSDLEVVDVDVFATGAVNILKDNENGNASGAVTFSGFTGSGNLTVTSDGNIGVSDGLAVDVGASKISLTSSGGNVTVSGLVTTNADDDAVLIDSNGFIAESGDTLIDITAASGGATLTAGAGMGNIITNVANMTLSNTAGDIGLIDANDLEIKNVTAGGQFLLAKTSGALTISGYTSSGNFAASAVDDITVNDGVIVNVGAGLIDLRTSTGDINVTGLRTTNNTTSAVYLEANAGQINDGGATNIDVDADSGRLTTSTASGINAIETRVDSLSVTNSGAGSITINEQSSLDLVTLDTNTSSTISALLGGDLTISGDIDLNGANGSLFDFFADNNLSVSGNICEGGATCGFADDSVTIDLSATGNVTVSDGVTVDSGNNLLSVNAGGAAQLTGLVSRNLADNAVDITAASITDSDADLLDVDVTTANGGVTLTSTGDTNDFVISSASATLISGGGGDFNLTSEADLDLKDLNTTGALVLVARSADTNVSGFTSASGFTISSNQAISIDDGVLVDVGAGQIGLQTTSGNITATGLRTTNAGADAILISTGNGQILDGGDTNLDADVTNGELDLFATTGISDLEIDAATATIQNITSGAVTLHQAAGEVIDLTTLSTAGDFSIDGTANITLSDAAHSVGGDLNLNASATGDLIVPDAGLSATGNLILAGNDLVDSDDTVSISGGQLVLSLNAPTNPKIFNTTLTDLSLAIGNSQNATVNEANSLNLAGIAMGGGDAVINTQAGGNLIVTGGIDLDGWNGGSLTLDADNDLQVTSNQDILDSATGSLDVVDLNFTAGNDVFVQINNEIYSYGGDITINAGGQFDTRNASEYYSSAGNISINANDVSLVSTLQSDSVDSNAVSIISADQIVDGGGAFIDIVTTNGGTILQAANGINLDTNVVDLDITNTTTGDIVIDEANDLNITGLSFSGGNATLNTAGGGDISFGADIDLNGSNGGTLTLNAANDILVNVNICDGGAACVVTPDDDVNITMSAGNDLTFDTNVEVFSGGGDIDLSAVNALRKLAGSDINSGAGLIDIQGNDVNLLGIVTSTSTSAQAIEVISGTDILDGSNPTLDLVASNGGIVLNAATGINLDVDAAQLDVTNSTSGNVVIDEDNTVDITALSFAGGDATITTLNAGDLTTGASLDLDGANGQTLSLVAANDLIFNTGGEILDSNTGTLDVVAVNLTAGNDMTFASSSDVDSYGGNIVIAVTGDYLSNSGSDIRADTGTITLNANDVRLIGSLRSNSALANAITVTSADQIVDGGAANVDIDARNGGIVLNAVNGIDFDAEVVELDATNTGTGAISIVEADDIAITNLNSVGDFNLTAGGTLTIPDAGLSVGANNIALEVDDIVDVSGRDVSLTATEFYLNVANLAADTSFTTSIANLDFNALGTGNVTLTNDQSLTLIDSTQDVDSFAATMGAGNLSLTTLAGANDITVSSDVDLDGANGAQLTLDAGNDLIFDTSVFVQDFATGSVDAVTVDFQAGNNFVLDQDSDIVSTGGDITIQATNALQKLRRSQINAGGGLIDLQGNSVELRGNTISTNGSASAIQVTSATTIVDGLDGTGTTDLEATAGGIVLSAATGIEIDTDTTTLSVVNSTSGNVTIQETDDVEITNLSGTGNFDFTAAGTVTLPNAGLNLGTNSLSLTADDFVDGAGRELDLTAGALTLSTAAVGGDLTFNTTADSLDLTNSGLNQVIIQDVDDLNLLSLTSTGSAAVVSGGVLTIPDAGINVGTSDLLLGGTDIVDVSGRELDITGGDLTFTTSATGGDLLINSSISSLNLTNTGTNDFTFNEADSLTITNLVSALGSASFTMPGNLTIPDAGLNLSTNNLTLSAADIVDISGRELDLTANQLSVEMTNPFADSILNTTATDLQVVLGTVADLTINETDGLNLVDITGSGAALSSAQGDITLTSGALQVSDDVQLNQGNLVATANGLMQIDANITASDALADGTREGMIDLAVDGANVSVGTGAATSIVSNNSVDQGPGGGLEVDPNSEVSIRIRQIDSTDTSQSMTFGDGAGSDVLIRAIGGDVYIDSEGGATLTGGNTRLVTLNSDVRIEAYDSAADPANGVVSVSGVTDNGVTTLARTGRRIQINQAPPVSDEPEEIVVPEVDEEELVRVVEDSVAESGENASSVESAVEEKVQSDNRQVASVFQAAFGGCQGEDEDNAQRSDCKVEQSMVNFLGTFMMGGELSGL